MKNIIVFLALSFYTSLALADSGPNLGEELGVMPDHQGNPAFAVTFTYGNDPDGKSYLLSFTPALSSSERSKHVLWNFYVSGSAGFLLPWDIKRDTSLAVIQILVKDKLMVETLLKNQGEKNGQNSLFFVLVDRNTHVPVYFLPISRLCTELPNQFKDLTNGNRCDQITNP